MDKKAKALKKLFERRTIPTEAELKAFLGIKPEKKNQRKPLSIEEKKALNQKINRIFAPRSRGVVVPPESYLKNLLEKSKK